MWYRDAALVAVRQQDLERELRAAAAIAEFTIAPRPSSPARAADAIRARSAAGIRRIGEAAIGLSRRIDVPECDAATYGTNRGAAAS